jgi:molybdate transport system substrate-binding protein
LRSNFSASSRAGKRIVGTVAAAWIGLLAAVASFGADDGALTVSCAASAEEAIDSLAARFERGAGGAHVRVNAGGSNLLARQIEAGADVDIFVSADLETLLRLATEGRVDSSSITLLASNRVVAIVPSDRPVVIREIADLAGPSIRRVAIADTSVPIGRYAEAFLRAVGLSGSLGPRTARTENTRATLAAIAAGAADLGFVYSTDARATDKVRIVYEVPPDGIPPVRIAAAIVRGHDGSRARAFLDLLGGPAGRTVFERLGFGAAIDAGR